MGLLLEELEVLFWSFVQKKILILRSKLFGIPDKFIEHASREEMIAECGLDSSP